MPAMSPPVHVLRGLSDCLQCKPLFTIWTIDDLTFIIEDHRRTLVQIERRPIRQIRMIRISGAREGSVSGADFVRESPAFVTGACHGRGEIDVIKSERNIQRVVGLQLAMVHRRPPRKVIEVTSTLDEVFSENRA